MWILQGAFILGIALAAAGLRAEESKMDPQTQDALIEKLETVLPSIGANSGQKREIELRLADLYSERGRLKDISAGEVNCTDCKGAESDRKKALLYYTDVFSGLKGTELSRVGLQISHLYRLLGQSKDAEKFLKRSLNDRRMLVMHPRAHLILADLAFEAGQLDKAKKEYEVALRGVPTEDQVYAIYRLAWVQLNRGQNTDAVRLIRLAVQKSQAAGMNSFTKDLVRDYATIMARNPFTAADVNSFAQMSPSEGRAETLRFLGEEAERLGNKKGALLIWSQYASPDTGGDKKDEAEIEFKFAQNLYDLGNYGQALAHLDRVTKLVSQEKCQDCQKVKESYRNLLVNWTKKEKTSPSASLSQAYESYLSMSPDDFEATVWAAQVARARNDHRRAYVLYETAAVMSARKGNTKEADETLATGIEIAEKSKDNSLYDRSLAKYLELNPRGELANQVRFQRAYLLYKSKNCAAAVSELSDIALRGTEKDMKSRMSSGDLALDCLSQMKKDKELRELAETLAHLLPEKKNAYIEMGRKVTVNRLIEMVRDTDPSESEVKSEIKRLRGTSVLGLSKSDISKQLRAILLASEKVKDFDLTAQAARELLILSKVSKEDRQLAQKSLLYVMELRFDFGNAYKLAQEMNMPNLKEGERDLRLGLLAELAGENPEKHFRAFLARTRTVRDANVVRMKLIRRNAQPWKEWDRQFSKLTMTPDLLAEITLELHLNSPRETAVSKALRVRGVSSQSYGHYMAKLFGREDLKDLTRKVVSHKLFTQNDRLLQKSIKDRMQLLRLLGQAYVKANRSGDLVLQARSLEANIRENARFARQLLALPAPRGLRASEKRTYARLLSEKARPFMAAAEESQKNLERLFSVNSEALKSLEESLSSENLVSRRIARADLILLKPYLGRSSSDHFNRALQNASVEREAVSHALVVAQRNPTDLRALENLRELEARRANGPMIAYLDGRIAQLKAEVRR